MKDEIKKIYYTAREAAMALGGNERTFRMYAQNNPLLITKCKDTHYRAPLKNWEKLLGLDSK
jgi:hypothetical protein